MDPFERMKRAVRDAINLPGRPGNPAATGDGGEAAFARGDFAEAEALLSQTVAELKARPADKRRYAKALLMLASTEWKQDKPKEARSHAEDARALFSEFKQQAELVESLDLLASIALKEGDGAASAKLFEEAVETSEKLRPHNPLTVANLLRHFSEALRKNQEFDRAKTAAGRALHLVQDRYGKDDVNTAECLLELGACETAAGGHEAAIEILRRALDIFQLDRGTDPEREVKAQQALATAYQSSGDLEKAVACYERALQLRERQMGAKASESAPLLTNLGSLLSLLGRYGPAIETLQQAVVRLEGARDERLGSALDLLGGTYFQFGRFEDAVKCVRRARTIWEMDPGTHAESLQANEALLADIGAFLPPQQRVALGLAPASEAKPDAAAARKRRRSPAPWDTPDESPGGRSAAHDKSRPTQAAQDRGYAGPGGFAEPLEPTEASSATAGARSPGQAFVVVRPDDYTASPVPPDGAPTNAGSTAPGVTFVAVGPDNSPMPQPARYPGPGPANAETASPGITFSVVHPDGSPAGAAATGGGPLHLTIMVGEGGVPATVATSAVVPAAQTEPVDLNGWDELGFDFLPGASSEAA